MRRVATMRRAPISWMIGVADLEMIDKYVVN